MQRRNRRVEAIEHLGGICTKCGKREKLELHFVGKHGEYKSFSNYKENSWSYILRIISNYTVACRAHRFGVAEHGTMTMYNNHKCRCASCKTAWAGYIYSRKLEKKRGK